MVCHYWLPGLLLLCQLVASEPLTIYYRTPSAGGIGGGTVLSIEGRGFAEDVYASSNVVWLQGEDGTKVLCDFISYTATTSRIQCRTRAYPGATEGEDSPPLKITVATGSQTLVSTYTFTYRWRYTFSVRTVYPSSSPLGSLIELAGNLPGATYTYDRLYMGDLQCDHIDSGTGLAYGLRWYLSKRHAKCRVENQMAGAYNASIQFRDWGNTYGASWNHSEAMYLMFDGSLGMFEVFPDIHSVSPHTGSRLGGTLITIKGSGFGTSSQDIEVDVDGVPCQVLSLNATHIQCWTGHPHDNDLSIADDDGTFSITASGHRFKGSRGVSVRTYTSGSISSLESLRSHSTYPDSPSFYSVYPSYTSHTYSRRRNYYGERLEAFFNPQATGDHSFFVAADRQAEVQFTSGSNINNLGPPVASTDHASGWMNYYSESENQRSEKMMLEEGQDYLLVSEFADSSGHDYINVAVLMHETPYTFSQTQQSNRERQLISLSTTVRYETQSLRVVLNASQLLAAESGSEGGSEEGEHGVLLGWGGDKRALVTAADLLHNPNDTVASALLSLFWAECSYLTESSIFHIQNWNDAVYGFEDETHASDDNVALWQGWNGDAPPAVVRNQSLCGRSSLYLREGRSVVFNLPEDSNLAIELEDYPYYMCMGYKLPPGYVFSLMFRLRGLGYWLSAYFNRDVTGISSVSLGEISNLDINADMIKNDDQWHYTCIDLQAIIANGFSPPDSYGYNGVHILDGFGFYADEDPESRGFYVDEFSFSHFARTLEIETYIPPSSANGIILENITATNESVALGNGVVAVTVNLEFNPLDCGYDFTPFSAELTNELDTVVQDVLVMEVQEASEPLGGVFSLIVNGDGYNGQTDTLPHGANTDEIKAALEAISGIGTVTVTNGPHLTSDRYRTGCPGRLIHVQFDNLAGDQPMILVVAEGLSGEGVSVVVSEEVPGGMMVSPVPGHMLQTVEKTPQVHVKVKGQLASCSGDHALYHQFNPIYDDTDFCSFSYSPPSTPHIISVSPTTARVGDTVTIMGSGFTDNSSLILVLFGDVLCDVTSASSDEVTCVLEEGTAGQKQIFLQVVDGNGGIAIIDDSVVPLEYTVTVDTVLPGEGSQIGGTEITITGIGFALTSYDSVEWNPGNEILLDAYQRALVANGNGCSGEWRNVVTLGGSECDIITADHMTITCITPANQNPGITDTYDVTVEVVCSDVGSTPASGVAAGGFTYSNLLTPDVTGVTPDQGSIHGGNSITITGTGFSDDPSQLSVKLGDAECSVTSATSTSITCTSPAHPGGVVRVSVTVEGKGLASGDVDYEFVFSISSISHCEGSLMGGQLLDINGEGFGSDSSKVEVSLGSYPCRVKEMSNTLIRCITSTTTDTHIIDNNATSVEYGLGYVWNPEEITIRVGDSILWNWYGTSFTRRLSVQQVAGKGDTVPMEGGFASESDVRGSFSHQFTEVGDYYFIAGGYGHIGFNGTVHVVQQSDISVPLSLTVNSVPMEIPPSATCGGSTPPQSFTHYTFSVSQTPLILPGGTQVFSYLDEIAVVSSGLSSTADRNLFTIGGFPCDHSTMSSTTLTQPDFTGPANNAVTYLEGMEVIYCEVYEVDPGTYRPVLHVAGKGWGLATSVMEILPSVMIDADQEQFGSLRGGTLLHISTEGLSFDDVTKLRVEIGNTPCAVQLIEGDEIHEDLYCLTQPAHDDGYSSIVKALNPIAYWTLQTDYHDIDGRYMGSDGGDTSFRNDGSIGSSGDASVRGNVIGRREGISGNSLTNQAVLFNNSYVEIPFHPELAQPEGFEMGLWLKISATEEETDSSGSLTPSILGSAIGSGEAASGVGLSPESRGPYQIVVDFASYVDGTAGGYVIVINPCGQPEFWLASGHSHHSFSGTENCPLLSLSDCSPSTPETCTGLSVVATGYLPTGVWNVIRCGDCNLGTDWGLVSVGLNPNSGAGEEPPTINQVFYFNNRLVGSFATTYSPPDERPLLIGGTDRLPGGGGLDGLTMSSSHLPLTAFLGHMDEVSMYKHTLEGEEIAELHMYGSSGKQKIWIRVEPVDGIGPGHDLDTVLEWNGAFDEVQNVDWNGVSDTEMEIDEGKALQFNWSGLKGVWQVTKETYESCDITNEPIKEWSPPRLGGKVVVWMNRGQTHYFIDPVAGKCLSGSKIKVKVGQVQVVQWTIDTVYSEISIPQGSGLLFQWSGSTFHDLVEMSSPQSTSQDCTFVGSTAQSLGKVVKDWQATPTTSGEVSVTGLSPGTHYFVCSLGNHCRRGMRVNVTVTTEDQQDDGSSTTGMTSQNHMVVWKIQDYSPLTILQGDNLTFSWEGFHSLHQVDKSTYDMCNTSANPVHIWGDPSVDTAVQLTDLQPGDYFFTCSIAGHCDAGMKIAVTVLPSDNHPTLLNPVAAVCHSSGGCSYEYGSHLTPYILDVQPSSGAVGTEIVISGYNLNNDGSTNEILIMVGLSQCTDITEEAPETETDSFRCTVRENEAGYHFVDFTNHLGRAAVAPSEKVPGPHRNISEPHGPNSPYPQFLLLPVVSSISPSMGSIHGGTRVTLLGSGFSPSPGRMSVLLGDSECAITSSTYSEIVCITSDREEGDGEVRVSVNGFESDASATYVYSSSSTPTIYSVDPATHVFSGNNIQISGENFGTNPSSVSVLILCGLGEWEYGSMPTESSCEVQSVTDTTITCSLPVKAAGEHYLVVHLTGRGLAASGLTVSYELTFTSFSPVACGNGGGMEITITGSGFPDFDVSDETESDESSIFVSFCSTECEVISSSLTELKCVLDTPSEDASSTCSDISVTYNDMRTIAAQSFEFRDDLTPIVTDISPLIGGTAGGTLVTILGNNLLPPAATTPNEDDVIVTIDSAVCVWYGTGLVPLQTSIECRTSDHRTTPLAEVKVFVSGRGFTLPETPDTQIWFQYIDRWSSPYTWGEEGQLPKEGDSVLIQRGQIVFLDVNTPVLNLILVEGELVFEDSQDLHLQAKYIFINTGRLQVGTEDSPFQHTARITLHGNVRDPEIPIYGAKVLGVRKGHLDLHGHPRLRTWTRLATTANVDSETLVLTESVDWKPGDKIVIAATGKDGNETEENEIASVSDTGTVLNLMHKLAYKHLGVTEVFEGGHSIDMRAEVGLLSHNVIVEGSQNVGGMGLGEDQYGAQIMIHRSGPDPTPIRIEHTEVRYGGQAFRLGRYAIHFHLTGSMSGSYVRNCAIHHSNNRALTAHGVHDLLVEGNVAYDIKGHTFFVEDGIETNNSYIHNLGVLTRGSSSLLNTDQIPATFWITNPQNKFVGNAAVASRGYGFWYDLDRFPSGASYTTSVCPNKEPFGQFSNNTAHTCNEFGLRIWEQYTPYENGCWGSNPSNATLYNFTTYNNGIHGVEFSVVGNVIADGFKIADNVQTGFEITEALGDWGEAVLQNSLIVGHTSHDSQTTGVRTGIRVQNLGRFMVSNVTFVNFDVDQMECLRACSHCKVREGGMQVWFEKLKFYNSPRKAAFQWEHEVLFRDLDGSLTGHPEGGWVLPDSALLPPTHCSLSVPEFSGNSQVGGASCTSNVYFLRLAWNQAQPRETLTGVSVNVTNEFGLSVVPWRHYRRTHMDGYMCTLPATYPHTIDWDLPIEHEVDTTFYSAGVYNIRPTDHVTITHRFVQLPDHVNLAGNYEPTESGQLPQYGVDPHLSWHINNNTNHTTNVTYLITGESTAETAPEYSDVLYTYKYEPCPRDGCIVIDEYTGPYEIRRWSDIDSWTNGEPPAAGDDVTIHPQWLMIVDVSPPPLGRVFVHGALEFEDGRDYNFTANLILIHGPNSRMKIGTAESPFQHRVNLTLTGRRRDSILPLASGLILGSKTIGVFGNVSMHGRPREVTWTRLSSSAMAGSSVISVETNTMWLTDDQIVIAPSGWGVTEGEIRTITAISGKEITLNEPLEHSHKVYDFLDPSDLNDPSDTHWWNDAGRMAPEIGLLSHNIVIQGGEDEAEPLETNHYGCRLLVGRYRAGSTVYRGLLWLDSVEFRHCGQGGYFSPLDPRYSIAFRSSRETSNGSYIRDCSIHHGYNTAVGVHASNGVTVSGNVVWRTVDSAFKIGGLENKALNNLAVYTTTVQPNRPPDNHAVDFPACFDVDAGNVVRGNAAAGSTRLGFRLAGEPCLEGRQPPSYEQAVIRDNTAHSCLAGLNILGLPTDCTAVTGFTATHQWNYAIFSSTASSLVVARVRVSVGKVGLNLNVFGPNPVQHFIGGKTISLSDSIIIGTLPGETCSDSQPSWTPGSSSIQLTEPSFGVMMSSFNQARSKLDGTAQWHLMKGYPVIDGALLMSDVVFARFTANSEDCPYKTFAIGNNPQSPDAVHPAVMTTTTLLNCHLDSLVFFHDPNPEWINQEDCIDMDCDGPKHALIDDRDGTFLGTHPLKGSVVPFAELRFADYSHRLPVTWVENSGEGDTPSQILEDRGKGVAKGQPSVNCEWKEAWNAYSCHSLDHRMLVIESMDADTETRRLSPLALDGGDTGHGPYTDLLNGPMDHGWCTYYTCLKRLSIFFTIVAMDTDYHIWMTGSNPSHLRFHVLNSGPDEALRLHIWYKNPQRKDIYRDGVYIEATNTVYLENSAIREDGGDEYIPPLSNSHSGANFFDRETQIMNLVIKGSSPVEIRTAPVVQVAVDLAVSLDDFFDPNNLISRLAFVLKIDLSTIRVVKIVSEESVFRRRRQLDTSASPSSTTTTTITLEFGDPPQVNITQPSASSVAQDIQLAGEVDDSVDIEDESGSVNQTQSGNPLNVDAPQSLGDFVSSLNDSVNQYAQLVDTYLEQADQTMAANMIGDSVINAILTNQVVVENATITGAVVVPAPPPPPPSPPIIPPEYENVISGEDGDNVTVDLVTLLLDILFGTEVVAMETTTMALVGGNESIQYVIPDRMVVTMEPREETGHLVHVKLTIYDANGGPVRNLGLVTPWMCQASLNHRQRLPENELAQLEGETSVPFVDGVAEFTRLRVDRKAEGLSLSFTTVPDRFRSETSIEFSVVLFHDTVERKQVSFLLSGVLVPDSVELNGDEVIQQVARQVGVALDVDPSRIQDLTLQELEWNGERVVYVELTMLGAHQSDPPDVPSLQEAGDSLLTLVNSERLTIEVGGVPLTAVRETFDITPSPPPTVSTATGGGLDNGDLVLILAGGGAVFAVGFSVLLVGVACCLVCRQKKRRRKDKVKKVGHHGSFSQFPRLQPTSKVNPVADDEGESSDDNIEVVHSYRQTYHSPTTRTTHLPSSPDLWDYGSDDDADSDYSSYNRSHTHLDCWDPKPSPQQLRGPLVGPKVGQQVTSLAVLANEPSSRQMWTAHPTHLSPPSHLTYVQPAPEYLRRHGSKM